MAQSRGVRFPLPNPTLPNKERAPNYPPDWAPNLFLEPI